MADLARYVVSLEAQTAKYQRELDRANQKLAKFHKDTTTRLDRISASMRTFGRAFAAGFAAAAGVGFISAIRNTLQMADNLDKMSVRLGINARELQAWGLIAERFNVSQTAVNLAIQRFTRRTAEAAQGTGEAKGALRELGIDARAFARLSLDERMAQLAGALENVSGESDKLRIAFKLFDSEGTSVLQFLSEGEAGLRKMRAELEGQLWSEEEIKRLSDLNTELTKLSQTLQLQFGPVLAAVGKGFSDFITDAQNRLKLFVRNVQAAAGNTVAAGKILRDSGIDPTGGGLFPGPADSAASGKKGAKTFPSSDTLLGRRARGINEGPPLPEIAQQIGEIQTTTAEAAAEWDEFVFGGMDRAKERLENFNDLFTQNLVEAASGGFDSILQSWARTLEQMAAKALSSQLFKLLGFGNENGGFLGLGKLFGGARAEGGPVSGGRSYLVGENGPELFTPSTPGYVHANGAGGNVFNIDARGATPGVEQRIRAAIETAVAQADRNRIEAARR